jgi:uncharacterized membrane protein
MHSNIATSVGTAFVGALVECIEALTVVLAIGAVRGWGSTLAGAGAALAVLALAVAAAGPAIASVPAAPLRLVVGVLTLLFGMRWLRKAVLRAAGLIPLHDEQAVFDRTKRDMAGGGAEGWDMIAAGGAFQIVMLEGTEVVVIVAALGAGVGMLIPAVFGAGLALLAVVALGLALHRPLAAVPENSLKLVTGVLLCAFGTLWTGEGAGGLGPGVWLLGEATLPMLILLWASVAAACVPLARALAVR